MKRSLILAAVAAASTTMAAGALAADPVTSPKVVIENATIEIPLELGSTVQVMSNGDLSIRCREAGCPGLGNGTTTGTNPPPAFTLSASKTAVTTGESFTLSWNATADVCYGNTPAGVTNWSGKAFGKSGSQAVSVGAAGTYTFDMRCYNAGGSTTSDSPAITATAPVVEPASGYCAEYYPTAPTSDERFTAWGFTKVEVPFQNIWGDPSGSAGQTAGVPGNYLVPSAGQYLAIPFVITDDSGGSGSQFGLSWVEVQSGIAGGPVSVTISPCPGDFRPPQNGTSDLYLGFACRGSSSSTSGNLYASSVSILSGCRAPKNKIMYINIATYNMFQNTKPTSTTCPAGKSTCGVSMRKT